MQKKLNEYINILNIQIKYHRSSAQKYKDFLTTSPSPSLYVANEQGYVF